MLNNVLDQHYSRKMYEIKYDHVVSGHPEIKVTLTTSGHGLKKAWAWVLQGRLASRDVGVAYST